MRDSLFNGLKKKFGKRVIEKLRSGEPVTGVKAWQIYEYLRQHGARIIYEDEEINDRECYIVFMRINKEQYYMLVKNRDKTKAYITDKLDKEQVEKILNIYNKCIG